MSSRAAQIDNALFIKDPVKNEVGDAVAYGTRPERDVECAARTRGNFGWAIVCLREVLPITRRAIDPAEHRLWRAARVGQRDAFQGTRRVEHLIAERDSTRADRERKGFACN